MHKTSGNVFYRSVFCQELRRMAGLMFVVFVGTFAFPLEAGAAGPWKGQIVDKETGKPLEGVVVLAVWRKCGFIVMNGCAGYYDSEEIVTGPDGRFVIQPRRSFLFFPPLRPLKGPDFYIFKPGYGRWQFQGQERWSKDALESEEQRKQAWKQFEGEGIMLELPRLKTREERLQFYQSPGRTPSGNVPPHQMKRWKDADDAERAYLGFR